MSQLYSDSIFWIEVDKIRPNPYQPRREFDQRKLEDLAESIRQYGVLQPLVVTRHEKEKPQGGIAVEYELIAGERRLRASKLAGVAQVPAVIRTGEQDNKLKLELAIIENLQREDLNPVDRATAFQRFIDDFNYKHNEIAKKVGKSREYVSNSLRLLALPKEILEALSQGRITEGHARPLMMLKDRPEEQMTVFKEVVMKKLTVREAEGIARRIAQDKIRKKTRDFNPEILAIEKSLTEELGTRVHIEPREVGGKIMIDFFNDEDLKQVLAAIKNRVDGGPVPAAAITTQPESPDSELPAHAEPSNPLPAADSIPRPETPQESHADHHIAMSDTNESHNADAVYPTSDMVSSKVVHAEENEEMNEEVVRSHWEPQQQSVPVQDTVVESHPPQSETTPDTGDAFDAMIEGESTAPEVSLSDSQNSSFARRLEQDQPSPVQTFPPQEQVTTPPPASVAPLPTQENSIPNNPTPVQSVEIQQDSVETVASGSFEVSESTPVPTAPMPQPQEQKGQARDANDDDLYAIRNFSV